MSYGVKCPYCGFINQVYVGHDAWLPKEVITCTDEGGCEKDFVIEVKKKTTIKTFKIEGEE